jgi:hypothetical protein
MAVFTAYVGLVLRWCKAQECFIQYQSDGRVTPTTENTIGLFASVLYLRMRLLEEDSFVDLLNRATREYCTAFEHADFSYLAAQVPRPELSWNSAFNWLPQGSNVGPFDLAGSDGKISCCPVRFAHPMARNIDIDGEPSIFLYDTEHGEIAGEVWFPLSRFSSETMERFGRKFLASIRALLRRSEERVRDVVLA